MEKHRIAAAGIILNRGRVLLVRYDDKKRKSFLVGPGGGVKIKESIPQALIREVKEETGLKVKPCKMLFVEDVLFWDYRMIKVWFLCKIVDGQLVETQEAKDEGIVEVGWYKKDQLQNEIVYPQILIDVDWKEFSKKNWELRYLELKNASF